MSCPELASILYSGSSSLVFEKWLLHPDLLELFCGGPQSHPRPFVPHEFCRKVSDTLHNPVHLGVHSSQALIGDCFVWSWMRSVIASWYCSCLSCQASKIQTHIHSLVLQIFVPEDAFTHMDIVGPLPMFCGYTYLLTAVDHSTHWPSLSFIFGEKCAYTLCLGWVTWFGAPLHLMLD